MAVEQDIRLNKQLTQKKYNLWTKKILMGHQITHNDVFNSFVMFIKVFNECAGISLSCIGTQGS